MTTWKKGSFEYLEAKIRHDNEGTLFGRDFEWVCKWFLENAPEYRGKFRHVWLWADWPDRWGPDCGIDLIAETREGHLWAIQAKATAPTHTVTKSEVDSFLAESNHRKISFRLLIATTDSIGTNARRTVNQQAKPASFLGRGDLVAAGLFWPAQVGGKTPRLKRAKPRPHQRAAINAVVRGFRDHDRGRLIMACGTGKTLTGLWIHERLKSKRTLLLVPSISLVQQNLREWGKHAKDDFDCLVVCSDESVARGGDDPALRYVTELGTEVTTDPTVIASFLRRRRQRPAVIIATYHSSDRVAAAQRSAKKSCDLILCDEAHRLVGDLKGRFAIALDANRIRSRRRLFMTATPRHFTQNARQRAANEDIELASMDDESLFGPEFHVLTFSDAINAKPTPLLTDYRVVVIGVTDSEAKRLVDQSKLIRTTSGVETDARTLASQIGLAKAMRDYNLKRVITFHRSIRRASRFTEPSVASSLPSVIKTLKRSSKPSGKLWARHISGDTPASQRTTLLRALAELHPDTRGVIANCACLGEGVDVPALDGIAFIDPKGSMVDIIQAVGRVIRLSHEKTIGTIVIPVFINENADASTTLDTSPFLPVWNILKALRAHDNSLVDDLELLKAQAGLPKHKWSRSPSKVILQIPSTVPHGFEECFFVKAVSVSSQRAFSDWLALCKSWCEQNHHDINAIKLSTTYDGCQIGRWLNNQRVGYRQGKLTEKEVAWLTEMGITWEKRSAAWERKMSLFRDWCEHHGSLENVVGRAAMYKGKAIGRMLDKLRALRRANRLAEDRERQLTRLGMIWTPHEKSFQDGLAACDQWIASGNTLNNCGRKTVLNGFAFSSWIEVQRVLYRKGVLPVDRQRMLEDRGMVWDPVSAKAGERREYLQRYVAAHGSLENVKQGDIFEGIPIGTMLNHRRRFFNNGTIDPEEAEFLTRLGMVWNPLQKQRRDAIETLELYKKEFGSFGSMTNNTVFNAINIGAITARWRQRHANRELDREIIEECRRIGFSLDRKKKRRDTTA